jgi:putative alpha-1,2-mannosidase
MRRFGLITSLIVCLSTRIALCQEFVPDPTAYVDPLIGTANGGNTFPGAVVPFGMVAWSPENTR